jgi:leucyl aminopeptidase (aminopeptidase T)
MIKKLTPRELAAGRNVMKQCLTVKAGEKVLIVTDPARLDLAGIFETTAKEFTDKVEVISFTGQTENAQEPPSEVAAKMKAANVALLVTSLSISHTQARKAACSAGCRIASMPTITRDIIIRTLRSDYSEVARLSRRLARILTDGKNVRLTAPGGTDLTLFLGNRRGDADTGQFIQPGDWGNLPAGEASIGPIEGTTQGILVIDGALAEIELDQPVIIRIKDGLAVDFRGGTAAQTFARLADAAGPGGRAVAELGVGTNRLARLSSNVLEAEKVYGTVHIALGNNTSYGGTINVPFHTDGVIQSPTLTIDGRVIVRDNKVLI